MASTGGSTDAHTIIPPSRRPDGSLRKPIRVRAGYIPQDEIAAWESPARRMSRQREQAGVPGWEDAPLALTASPQNNSSSSKGIVGGEVAGKAAAAAPLTKSQKRNLARKKGRELKQQDEGVERVTAALAQTKIAERNGKAAQERTDRSSPVAAAGGKSTPSSIATEELSKKVKAVQKKLRQVNQLQAKVDAGEVTPTQEQLQKLEKKSQFEKELKELQAALASAKQ